MKYDNKSAIVGGCIAVFVAAVILTLANTYRAADGIGYVCRECAGPVVEVPNQEPQHQSVEELWSDIMSKGSNKVYHVMMNHVEYAFWVSFENSSEYIMRLYPEQQMTDGAYAPQTQGDAE